MIKFIKENYKVINIIALCLCVYVFCLPITSRILEKVLPGLTLCPFLIITGKPCPLCGGTRFIQNLSNVFKDVTYVFNFFGICIIVLLIEIIFRIINLFKKNYSYKKIYIDIIIHLILLLLLLIYEIVYIILII